MKISAITQTEDIADTIKILKGTTPDSKVTEYKKQYETAQHETLDKSKRPDKKINNDAGELERMEKVNRLAFPLQKKIVGSTVAFTFGNPVTLLAKPKAGNQEVVLNAIKRILTDCKIDSFNRKIARELARSTETAECWYMVPVADHEKYGFKTKFKLRVHAFTPWDGDLLYPYYDEAGDLIAFSRGFKRTELVEGKKQEVEYFETYTDEEITIWKKVGNEWEEYKATKNEVGKIPVIYGKQEQTDWADVQWSIERLEYLLSNFADTNDYHGSPKIVTKGEIKGFSKKGESGAIIEMDEDGEAEYLSWQHAPESVKLEIETLIRFIYTFTQTPDISFDSVKGLQAVSGIALRMLFMDAHLKVQDKREVFDEYLTRRINLLKAFIGKFNKGLQKDADELEITPQINPYMIDDLATTIDELMTANGNKPIISHRTSVARAGLVDNVEAEFALIEKEETASRTIDITEPTV